MVWWVRVMGKERWSGWRRRRVWWHRGRHRRAARLWLGQEAWRPRCWWAWRMRQRCNALVVPVHVSFDSVTVATAIGILGTMLYYAPATGGQPSKSLGGWGALACAFTMGVDCFRCETWRDAACTRCTTHLQCTAGHECSPSLSVGRYNHGGQRARRRALASAPRKKKGTMHKQPFLVTIGGYCATGGEGGCGIGCCNPPCFSCARHEHHVGMAQ